MVCFPRCCYSIRSDLASITRPSKALYSKSHRGNNVGVYKIAKTNMVLSHGTFCALGVYNINLGEIVQRGGSRGQIASLVVSRALSKHGKIATSMRRYLVND
ncbi:hypothetical protein Zmor_015570 [Zophobas morio]|uniref:Uncharacterized protein n=1 Tax=Zophobas morio TaxID=2755281 RepID=A0AA38MHC6_9CUCU|nr:hypothetical protein Zmor_015570 [Zophobas morio]